MPHLWSTMLVPHNLYECNKIILVHIQRDFRDAIRYLTSLRLNIFRNLGIQ
jgi:hypothetical protein